MCMISIYNPENSVDNHKNKSMRIPPAPVFTVNYFRIFCHFHLSYICFRQQIYTASASNMFFNESVKLFKIANTKRKSINNKNSYYNLKRIYFSGFLINKPRQYRL